MGAKKQGKLRKSGQPYRFGKDSPIHDEYFVTADDAVRGILADPDLDPVEKSQAIRLLAGQPAQQGTNFLNEVYKKAYGSDVSTTTPLAKFIREIFERRNKAKKR